METSAEEPPWQEEPTRIAALQRTTVRRLREILLRRIACRTRFSNPNRCHGLGPVAGLSSVKGNASQVIPVGVNPEGETLPVGAGLPFNDAVLHTRDRVGRIICGRWGDYSNANQSDY